MTSPTSDTFTVYLVLDFEMESVSPQRNQIGGLQLIANIRARGRERVKQKPRLIGANLPVEQ